MTVKVSPGSNFAPNTHEYDGDLQTFTYLDCLEAIDLTREYLTLLDSGCFNNDNLSPELFMNFKKWVESLIKEVARHQILNAAANSKPQYVMAETNYFEPDATAKKIDVRVQEYDPTTAKFLVDNEQLKVATWRSRLFMRLKTEPADVIANQRLKVKRLMQETKEYLRVQRLIQNDMMRRYPYVTMPDEVRKNIQKRVSLKKNMEFNESLARKLVLQIEA